MSKRGIILLAAIILILAFFSWMKWSGFGTQWLWDVSQSGKWLLPLILISAIIDSINPCAFSVLLLTIAFLFSIGKLRAKILQIGGAYIFGIFAAYILIGLGILKALHLFNTPNFMGKLGAGLLIVLGGINLINEFFPKFPIKLRIPHSAHETMAKLIDKISLPTAFILGAFVGLCEFPCTGGPYLMVVGLLHDQATYFSGLGYLFLYNLLFILPLVIILLIASDKELLAKVQAWQSAERKDMRVWAGILMLAVGALILLFV